MIQHKDFLLSLDLFEKQFVCNIRACKGACCIEGEWGAPIENAELKIIDRELENIKPFMNDKAKTYLAKDGFFEIDPDGDKVTTCLPDGACVFANNENGTYTCAIEKAHLAGKTEFRKPISCHLYPIRLSKVGSYTALNYNYWEICSEACKLGEQYGVPVFKFLKEAIIRKFGEDFYNEIEQIADEYEKSK